MDAEEKKVDIDMDAEEKKVDVDIEEDDSQISGSDKCKPLEDENTNETEESHPGEVEAEILGEDIESETEVTDDEPELTKEEISELKKKAEESDEIVDKLQRVRAEYLNFQKRKNKEVGDIRRFAVQGFAIALTDVLDNFSRAISSTKDAKDFDKLLEGIQLVEGQFYKTLEDYNVKPIETVGKAFDPVMHEAVIEEADDSYPHHTVIMELQKGFMLFDRVIRPAKVKVSKKEEKCDAGDSDNDQVEQEQDNNDN